MDLATDVLKTLKELKKNKKATHLIIEGPEEFVFTMISDEDVSTLNFTEAMLNQGTLRP
jgi:hypothetical protein